MKNKLLLEELKRFNKIISYNPENPMINEDTQSSTIDKIIEKIKPLLPVSKYHNKYRASSLIQAILVDSGYCVYRGKKHGCDYIDGDFGSTTEESLKEFIGKKELTKDDTQILKASMENPNKKGSEVKIGPIKSYGDTINKYDKKIVQLEKNIKNSGIDLESLTPEFRQYFMDWFGFDRKLGITGEEIESDILKFIVSSEGGISDGPKDETAFAEAMRHPYNTLTKVLNYNGTDYTLTGGNLPKPTKSKIDSSSYSSEHWHTNKGIVYGYYEDNIGGKSSLETAKSWLNLSDQDVLDYYMKYFYDGSYSEKYDVINHFFGLAKWNSGPEGANILKNKVNSTFQKYGGIDGAIEKLGIPVFFDILNNLRIEQYMGYKNFETYGSGWLNSILNFYWYFKSKYIDPIADEAEDDMSMELYNMGIDDLEILNRIYDDNYDNNITDDLT